MQELPILYSFRRCPYAIRARMTLSYSGIRWQHREVHLKRKPAALIEASPKGTVPVLVLADGAVLEESLEIMGWALAQSDPEGWRTTQPAQQAEIEGIIAELDGPFKAHLDGYKYASRESAERWLPHRDACELFLAGLNERLCATAYLFGDRCCAVDVAVFPFVRQFANVQADWFAQTGLEALRRWLQHMLSSSLFVRSMQKLPAWQPGDAQQVCG